jgi:hypothetical protein
MASRSSSPGAGGSRRGSVVGTDLSGGAMVKKFMNGWTKEQETLMADWADIAGCYRWLNDRAEKIYAGSNMWITIPVIILSTLGGTANFAIDSFIPPGQDEIKKYASAAIGGISIFAGVLTTLGNFFQYAQKSEAHRVAGIAWGKFQRQVTVELAINPMERIEAMDFLKICRQDLDRLIEQSPPIPDPVIAQFEREFKTVPNLKVPDICHGIEHTRVYDSSKARLGKITAEAALHLKHKKRLLKDDILPDINQKIEQELNTRIEARIKALLPSPPITPPAGEKKNEDLASAVSHLETDWRKLLVGKRHLFQAADATNTIVQPTPVRPSIPIIIDGQNQEEPLEHETIHVNVVGTDGPPPSASPPQPNGEVSFG